MASVIHATGLPAKSSLKASVARLSGTQSNGIPKQLGTAFPLSKHHLVTCKHCIPDECRDLWVTFPQHPGLPDRVACELAWSDARQDLAVLTIKDRNELPSAVALFSFGAVPQEDAEWWSFGYPAQLDDGDNIKGTVDSLSHITQAGTFMRLSCVEGDQHLKGMSGAPVIVGRQVVGVIASGGGFDRVDAVTFDTMRERLATLADALEAHGAHCRWSHPAFPAGRFELLAKAQPHSQSNLRYLLLEVRNDRMSAVKAKLEQLPATMDRRQQALQATDQVVVWSLLGSKELLVQIRAPEVTAEHIEQIIEDDFGDDVDIESVKVKQVFAPERRQLVPVLVRSVDPPEDVNLHRFKAFLHLMLGNAESMKPVKNELYLKSVLDTCNGLSSIVDLVSCNRKNQTIIIELTLPCGHFGELFELTGRMEHGFDLDLFSKSTYLAYKVAEIWPRGQRAANNDEGD